MKKYVLKGSKPDSLRLVAPQQLTIDYRKELNDAQFQAVSSTEGPHLIIAGAGTGKTRTIVYRVSYLIECGVHPESILLLTFTRRAAREMLRRAVILLDGRCEQVAGGTFHSFANGVLRRYAELLNYDRSFTILDQGDSQDVLNLIRTRLKFDAKGKRFPRKDTLYDLHSRSVNTLSSIESLLAADYPHYLELLPDLLTIEKEYASYKAANNLMDYDDLLLNLARLLQDQQAVRASLSKRFRYIMVDEYQDTNRIQGDIVRLLAFQHENVFVVGDDAQSIYSFRGSTLDNIREFPERFPGCTTIKLEENFRSSQPILNLANEILRRATKP
ncbi:MAG TPA: ATP-dependent helicase [Bacteroidota bacterium]|nr:ATP-dependent helicase [Bacteroidota bacterium]